jgi:NTE family protein
VDVFDALYPTRLITRTRLNTISKKTTQPARRPSANTRTKPLTLDLALQGGGSHGAFTWGVLDRLLQEEDLLITGISGTSAGALNGVALAAGLVEGGRQAARETLRRLWERVGALNPQPAPGLVAMPWLRDAQSWWGHLLGRTFSPYQLNPLNLNPLRDLLEDCIDFDRVRRCDKTQLFIAATHVKTGSLRIFRQAELSVDVVLASACLPLLFQAVEIDGEAYWDGGYAGNPSLLPLITDTPADDLMLVQINPRVRDELPIRSQDILDRMNEITFNASLLKELRSVALMRQLLVEADESKRRSRHPSLQRIAALRVHRIDGDVRLQGLGASSKLETHWGLLSQLHDLGHEAASQWLTAHRADLGQRATVDLAAELLT